MKFCRHCSAALPSRRSKYCPTCAAEATGVKNRERATAWRRARGIPPTVGGARVGCGRRRKPRAVCTCGAQSTWAKADGPPWRCRRCAGLASRGYRTPERACLHCGTLFRSVGGRRCCKKACAIARMEENTDRQRVPVEQSLHKRRASRRRGSAKRWAALKQAGVSPRLVTGRWRRICERDGWVCWICKGRIDSSLRPTARDPCRAGTADHVIPVGAPGWSDDDSNLRAAHYGCNSRRHGAPPPS